MTYTRATTYFLSIAGISRRPTAPSWFTTAKSQTGKTQRDLATVVLWLCFSIAHPITRFPFCMQITTDGPDYSLNIAEIAIGPVAQTVRRCFVRCAPGSICGARKNTAGDLSLLTVSLVLAPLDCFSACAKVDSRPSCANRMIRSLRQVSSLAQGSDLRTHSAEACEYCPAGAHKYYKDATKLAAIRAISSRLRTGIWNETGRESQFARAGSQSALV